MDRRDVLKLSAGFAAALFLARGAVSMSAAESLASLPMGESMPFSEDVVIERARQLSQAPYAPPEDTIQPHTKTLITTSIAPSASRKIWRCGGTTI